jgi:hypothetical protein
MAAHRHRQDPSIGGSSRALPLQPLLLGCTTPPIPVVESSPSAVAIGRTYPLAPRFLWECLTGPSMTRFLGPAHRTGRAVFPHPALGLVSRQGMQAATSAGDPPTVRGQTPPQRSRWLNAGSPARGPCVVTLGLDVELPLKPPDLIWELPGPRPISSPRLRPKHPEPGPLPSTGIARLPWYYWPLRHPPRPAPTTPASHPEPWRLSPLRMRRPSPR